VMGLAGVAFLHLMHSDGVRCLEVVRITCWRRNQDIFWLYLDVICNVLKKGIPRTMEPLTFNEARVTVSFQVGPSAITRPVGMYVKALKLA
jgi:hypothetical protein